MDRRLFLKGLGVSGALLGKVSSLEALVQKNRYARQYDVIIVGSGPAGLSLADKLSANGVTVAVLESGKYKIDSQHQSLANVSKTNPLPFDLNIACQRLVGGSSLIWGGYCPRYLSSDFVSKSKYGYGVDWPFTYEELERHYCKAEKWLQVGIDNNIFHCKDNFASPFQLSSEKWIQALNQVNIKNHVPASVCVNQQGIYQPLQLLNEHAPRLRNRQNLDLFIDATVRRIAFDNTGRATGVHITHMDRREVFIEATAIVLAGGAIQNTRILQLSDNSLFPDGAGNGGGHLGANFMEHPHVRFWIDPSEKWQKLPPSLLHLYGWYESNKQKSLGSLMVLLHRFDRRPRWLRTQPYGNLLLDVMCEQEPREQNLLTLDKYGKDIFGDPIPNLNYSFSNRDQETIDSAPNSLQNLLSQLGGKVIKDTGAFGAHLMGTTRMAKSENEGVVDSNQRVFGTKNLYVSGSSVFPTGGASNPTLTLTALSLRLGEHLLEVARHNGFTHNRLKP